MCLQAAIIQSPLPWEQLKSQKFASTKLWVLVGFLSCPGINPLYLAAEERRRWRVGSEALALEEGSTGASQIQSLPHQPLHVEPLKPLEHLPLVARGFPRTAATSGHAVRESWRAPLKLFPPGEGSFEQNRRDDFPSPSLLYSSSPSQLLPNLPAPAFTCLVVLFL